MSVLIHGWAPTRPMVRSARVSVEPTEEPISLVEAQLQCRASDADPLLLVYRKAARQTCEQYCERALFTQTVVLTQDRFTNVIELPMAAPLQSVTAVKYYDTAAVQQTLATSVYRVDTASPVGRIVLKPDQVWPELEVDRGQAVEVTYVAGWTPITAIPEGLRIGILLLITHLYENRGAVQLGVGLGAIEVPMGVAWFWEPYKRVSVG